MEIRIQTHHEGWDVDHPLPDMDVTMIDLHSGMMDTLREPEIEDSSLETTIQELFQAEGQDDVEFQFVLLQEPETVETAHEGLTFEHTLGMLLWRRGRRKRERGWDEMRQWKRGRRK